MIKSVAKAVEILMLFSPEEPRLSLAEIARRSGLPKATVHSLLATLVHYGLVERTDDGRYALGTALIPLTQAVRVNVELRDRAAPLLRELADATRESVYLTVRDGDFALYIYAVESPRRLLARTAYGCRRSGSPPLHGCRQGDPGRAAAGGSGSIHRTPGIACIYRPHHYRAGSSPGRAGADA